MKKVFLFFFSVLFFGCLSGNNPGSRLFIIDKNVDDINGFIPCSGAQWLGADGACHAFGAGGGVDTNWQTSYPVFDANMALRYYKQTDANTTFVKKTDTNNAGRINYAAIADLNKAYYAQLDANRVFAKTSDVNGADTLRAKITDVNAADALRILITDTNNTGRINYNAIADLNKAYYAQLDANNVFYKKTDLNGTAAIKLIAIADLNSNFVPYRSATKDVNLGDKNITTTGNIFIGNEETDKIELKNNADPYQGDTELQFTHQSPSIDFYSRAWNGDSESEEAPNYFGIYSEAGINDDMVAPGLVIENKTTGNINTRFLDGTSNQIKSTGELIIHANYQPDSVWIDFPVGVGSQSGMGFGGFGANPFFAYCGNDSYWAQGAAYQDVAYRNTSGRMLFANDPSYNAVMSVSKAPARYVDVAGNLNVYNTYGVMGAEKISNPYFATGTTSWTLGAAWQWVDATDNVQKFQSGTSTLSQTSAAMVTPLIIGESYKLSYQISSISGGGITPTIGGATLPYRFKDGTFYETFTATSTASLVFTPDSAALFYIDNITLWKITQGDASIAGNIMAGNTKTTDLNSDGKIRIGTATTTGLTTGDLNASGKIKGSDFNLSNNKIAIRTDGNITITSPDGTIGNCGMTNTKQFVCS